jgi:phage tail tape measure protein, TP901 family|nr:MAG TPA: minor tail protein [Caudoviricetes sp.]
MNNNLNFGINFNLNGDTTVNAFFVALQNNMDTLQTELKQVNKTLNQTAEGISKSVNSSFGSWAIKFSTLLDLGDRLSTSFSHIAEPGIALNQSLAELSAITGVTGEGLEAIEKAARTTAKTFGTDATANVEAYKMMLSQLSPDIAKNSEAMKLMGENVNILSKQMGGDTVAATDVLTTSLNQFGVSMDNPIEAAHKMADMMNVMSAAAQEGSAELPQIKEALEQVGMVAKSTGVSFEETNAWIQILDKAGKKGSEGGIAMRNVITTLSEGRFTSKLAAEGLKEAGISTEYLANQNIPLHERLNTLKKIQGDTALMTKVFGKENMAAAIAMIQSTGEAERLTKAVYGTSSANEQAAVIGESAAEKNARLRASIEDMKISLFNATGGALGYAQAIGGMIGELTNLGPVLALGWKGITMIATASGRAAIWQNILALKTAILTGAQKVATIAQWAWNVALSANPIGIIIVAITALIAGIVYLVSKVSGWGEAWKHTWNGAKLLVQTWVEGVKLYWNTLVNGLMIGINKIKEGWYNFKNAMGIGDKAENNKMLAQIHADTEARKQAIVDSAKKAAETGKKAVEEFKKAGQSLHWKKDEQQVPATEKKDKSAFALKPTPEKIAIEPTKTIGGVAATSTQEKNKMGSTAGSSKIMTLNIGKMIENINIQVANIKESKQQIAQAMQEALTTAIADFSVAT